MGKLELRLKETDEILSKYKGKVKKSLIEIEKLKMNDIIGMNCFNGIPEIEKCQSPIEELYYIYLRYLLDGFNFKEFSIIPQFSIKSKNNNYKADFYITVSDDFLIDNNEQRTFYYREANLCVECDGHAFHEKTKQQAQRDKKRERDIISKGYKLIRFTGSEIYSDPKKCAIETIRILESDINAKKFETINEYYTNQNVGEVCNE